MNAPATSMEPGVLRQLSDRLRAPLPRKTRFLLELSGDVRALTLRLVEDGFTPEEAHRRALDALVPDDETLRRLEGLHRSWYRRATAGWTETRLKRAERMGLAAAFLLLLTIQTATILSADFVGYVSPFLWPVLASGAAVVLAVGRQAFRLWVKEDYVRPGAGLKRLLALSVLPPAVAAVGTWLDVVRLADLLTHRPELEQALVLRSLIQDAAMLAIAILFALLGGLGWLLLHQWSAIQEDAHRRALDTTTFPEE